MSRASSAGVYGSGTPLDLARVNYRRAPRAHGLVSESAPVGWYPAPRTPRKARPKSGPVVSNMPDPVVVREQRLAAEAARRDRDDDIPVITYGYARSHSLPSIGLAMANDD